MDAAQRAELIRRRYKGRVVKTADVGRGVARAEGRTAEHPKRVRYVTLPTPTGHGFVSCGPLQAVAVPAWVETADHQESPTVACKRRRGVSALTRIAQQLPAKLPRVLFDL